MVVARIYLLSVNDKYLRHCYFIVMPLRDTVRPSIFQAQTVIFQAVFFCNEKIQKIDHI